MRWKEEKGTLESLYAFGLNAKTRGLFIAYFKDAISDYYYEIPLKVPRFGVGNERIVHHFKHSGVTLVHSVKDIKGDDIPRHYSEWTAIDGTDESQILYVQSGSAKAIDVKKGCLDFNGLPDHLAKRRHVSVVMRGADVCMETDSHFRQLIGEYREVDVEAVRKTKIRVPVWACDIGAKKCRGKVPNDMKEKLKSFLV